MRAFAHIRVVSSDRSNVVAPEIAHRLRILVVDDERSLRGLLGRLLKRAGYSVKTAADGAEALSLFSDDANRFDLVITDHDMPTLRGLDLVEGLARIGYDGKVIVCSAYLCPDLEKQYRGVTECECLSKPVQWETLRDTVAHIAAEA